MEELSGIPEKMTAAEFEELYNKAASRVLRRERQAVQDSLEATIRAVVREELSRMFLGDEK
jgi:hypothetical protein